MKGTNEVCTHSRYVSDNEEWFFETDDGLIGQDGKIFCPVCSCCTLELATVVPHSVFAQTDIELGIKKSERRLVCSGGCDRTHKHEGRNRT